MSRSAIENPFHEIRATNHRHPVDWFRQFLTTTASRHPYSDIIPVISLTGFRYLPCFFSLEAILYHRATAMNIACTRTRREPLSKSGSQFQPDAASLAERRKGARGRTRVKGAIAAIGQGTAAKRQLRVASELHVVEEIFTV